MNCADFHIFGQVFKTQIIRSLTYKFEVYSNILMQAIIMVASAFFWKALFQNSSQLQGVSVDQMLVYTVVSSMISVILTTNVEQRITTSVRKGTIAIDMMRPVNIYFVFLAEDFARVTVLIFQNLLPIVIIGSIFIQVPRPASTLSFLLFLLSLCMAFWMNWLMAVLFGMIAFWTMNMDALIQVKKHLIRLLSGSIIPLWFFPDTLRNILECLPFAYLYQLPLNLYIGKYDNGELMKGLLVQFGWLIVFAILFFYQQRRVTEKVMIQGG